MVAKALEKPKAVKTVKGLPAVPESVLKHRKRRAESRQLRLEKTIKKKKEHDIQKRKEIFKRAEQYVKEYRLKERDEIRLIRQAKSKGNFYVPAAYLYLTCVIAARKIPNAVLYLTCMNALVAQNGL